MLMAEQQRLDESELVSLLGSQGKLVAIHWEVTGETKECSIDEMGTRQEEPHSGIVESQPSVRQELDHVDGLGAYHDKQGKKHGAALVAAEQIMQLPLKTPADPILVMEALIPSGRRKKIVDGPSLLEGLSSQKSQTLRYSVRIILDTFAGRQTITHSNTEPPIVSCSLDPATVAIIKSTEEIWFFIVKVCLGNVCCSRDQLECSYMQSESLKLVHTMGHHLMYLSISQVLVHKPSNLNIWKECLLLLYNNLRPMPSCIVSLWLGGGTADTVTYGTRTELSPSQVVLLLRLHKIRKLLVIFRGVIALEPRMVGRHDEPFYVTVDPDVLTMDPTMHDALLAILLDVEDATVPAEWDDYDHICMPSIVSEISVTDLRGSSRKQGFWMLSAIVEGGFQAHEKLIDTLS